MEEQFNGILFTITEDQINIICKYFDKNVNELEDYEICELLDKIIDKLN